MKPNKIKRRRYLVMKGTQLRYMGLVALPLIASALALYGLLYYCVFSEILIPEGVIAVLLPAMKRANSVLIFSAPILLFFVLRAALIYSNRIIGPIPRLERELDKAIAGEDYSVRIKARQDDELKGFIEKVNLLLEKMDSRQPQK